MIKILEGLLDWYVITIHNKKLLKLISKKNLDSVVDVGSHKLELYLSLNKFKFEFKHYLAFEPEKVLFKKLKKKFGKDVRVELHNIALGSIKESKNIATNIFSSTNTFSEVNQDLIKYKIKKLLIKLLSKNTTIKNQTVQVLKLDDFVNRINHPVSILKIDTEGHEKQVLEGAKKFITIHHPEYLIIEIQKNKNYKNYNPENIEKLISDLKYEKIYSLRGPFNLFSDNVYKTNNLI